MSPTLLHSTPTPPTTDTNISPKNNAPTRQSTDRPTSASSDDQAPSANSDGEPDDSLVWDEEEWAKWEANQANDKIGHSNDDRGDYLCPPRCTGEHRGNVAPGTGEKISSTGKVPASVHYYQKPSLQAATSRAAIIPASFFVFFF